MKYSWKKTYKSNTAKSVRRRKYSRSALTAVKRSITAFFKNLTVGKLIGLTILVLLFIAVYFVFWSPFFKIDTIETGDSLVESLVSTNALGKNIFFVSINSIREYVLANDSKVNDLIISKKYPATLQVTVSYREPLAVVTTSQSISSKKEGERVLKMREFLIDEAGVVFSESTTSVELPKVDLGDKTVQVGDTLKSSEVETYLQVLANLRNNGIQTDWVKIIEEKVIEAKISTGPTVLISSQKRASDQIEALQVILTKYKIKETPLAKIDLRFDKPVVEYKN